MNYAIGSTCLSDIWAKIFIFYLYGYYHDSFSLIAFQGSEFLFCFLN